MITFAVDIGLGIIAVQTRSLIPCALLHEVHNRMAVLISLSVGAKHQSSRISGKVRDHPRPVSCGDGLQPESLPGRQPADGPAIIFRCTRILQAAVRTAGGEGDPAHRGSMGVRLPGGNAICIKWDVENRLWRRSERPSDVNPTIGRSWEKSPNF